MESFFSRYKNALVLIIVLLAQVVGVAIQVRRPLPKAHAQPDAGGVRLIRYWAISVVSPPERFVHWLGASILGVWDNYIDLTHVRQQNKDLQSELRRLRIEQGGMVEDARQGQRLEQLLAFQQKYIYKTVPAQVIGNSGTEQSRILSLNKGSKDGIAVDMPVITADGIVGRVREVFPHSSQVLEITDPTSGAGVMLATTRIRGILRGNSFGQPQVVNVLPDDRIKAGEQVVTSGGDQIFPRGLAVGTVERVFVDPDKDPLVDVLIHPAANLSQLEEVLVITGTGPEVMPRQKLDMLQSAAAANAEQLKASEILAERLPSRVDPDAPPDAKAADGSMETASAAGGDPGRPLRPLLAVRPDRFSPNTTPSATSLTPGARLAPQAEGHGDTPRPRPAAQPVKSGSVTTPAASETAEKKKSPETTAAEGSRSPGTPVVRPAATTSAATPRPAGTPAATRPAVEAGTTNPETPVHRPAPAGTTAVATPRPAGTPAATTRPAAGAGTTNPQAPVIHRPAPVSAGGQLPAASTPPAAVRPASPAAPTATNPSPAARSASAAPNSTQPGVNQTPRTRVVVDGPLPSAAKKPPAVSAGTPPVTGTQHPATAPIANSRPATTSPAPAANNAQRPPATAAPQRRGPELVPDDGSRPPPSMLRQQNPNQNQPKPQTQRPANSQQPSQPQGGR